LNNEGIVWVQGLDFMYDVFGNAPDTFVPGQFVNDFMGIQSYAAQSFSDDGGLGLPQLDVVAGNPLCTMDSVLWVFETMNFADGFAMTNTARGVYKMGPEGYPLDTLYSGVYNQKNNSRIFSLAVETARIDTQENTDILFEQVLESFKNMGALATYKLNLKALLEGTYSGSAMSANLNQNNLLPTSQPYNVAPWNYQGTEAVDSISNADIVDWVLVEIRNAASADLATPASRVARQAAFVLKNGSIISAEGTSFLSFTTQVNEKLFVVIYHRNHLGIMSSSHLMGFNYTFNYNFTLSSTKAYGVDAQILLAPNVYGMRGGDTNGDGVVNEDDIILNWNLQAGSSGYLSGDANMDGEADNKDKNTLWYNNSNNNCQVPE